MKNDELKEFFNTYVATLNKKKCKESLHLTSPHRIGNKNLVLDIVHYENGAYVMIELASREDSKTCLGLDNTDWQGYKIRVSALFN